MTRASELLASTGHRPWPVPRRPWFLFQSWRRLLFVHWPVPVDRLRPLVPGSLELDTFQGVAWVGVTPFALCGLRPRWLPPPVSLPCFRETNLRTYVRAGGRAGVYFFTLEADSRLAVLGARSLYRLPYRRARMQMEVTGDRGWIRYRSRRVSDPAPGFRARYRPTGSGKAAAPASLEYFLTERYALYVVAEGKTFRGEIHHRPWLLQPAEAAIEENGLPSAHRIDVPEEPPMLHFSERQDTLVWSLEELPPAADRSEDPGSG